MLNLEKTHDHVANFAGKATSLSNSEIEWVLDSGASDHMTCHKNVITPQTTTSFFSPIKIPDGSFVPAKSCGDVLINPLVTLKNVLYIPSFTCNLISISKLTQALNCVAHFFSLLLCITGLTHEEADWNG